MDFPACAGALANAAGRIDRGLEECRRSPAGVLFGDIAAHFVDGILSWQEDTAAQFCNSPELQVASKKFGEAAIESELQPEFTELERLELEVNFNISPDEILRRGGQSPEHWEFRGILPRPGTTRVTAVIGTFNRAMTRAQMVNWLYGPFYSSGAWVREAYLQVRPEYDGRGAIAFPCEGSRWHDLFGKHGKDERDCMPGLWHDDGRMGVRSLDDIGDPVRAGRRVVFLVHDGV